MSSTAKQMEINPRKLSDTMFNCMVVERRILIGLMRVEKKNTRNEIKCLFEKVNKLGEITAHRSNLEN